MSPRSLAAAPALVAPDYTCISCRMEWRYDEVRHVLCCPDCGGGLWRDPTGQPLDDAQRSGRSG